MKKINISKFIIFLLCILLIISSFNLIHAIYLLEGIENIGRTLVILILLAIDIIFLCESIRKIKNKKKRKKHITMIIFMIIYILINLLLSFFIKNIYSDIKGMNKDKITYSTTILTLADSNINNINDLNNKNIGMLEDENSIEGNILPNEFINENNLIINKNYYESYPVLMEALYSKEIEAIFIKSEYESMFKDIEKYKNITTETKIITTYNKKMDKITTTEEKNLITEPFTVLLMGVDSHLEGIDNQVANGDALILVTFNPNTLSATMLSIPRDSYVPQACFKDNIENKITHASWGGTDCMIQTIENFLDINIDYYVKINFKGVVQLVDAVGGITVNVPKDLCANNSDRGENVCISKGIQTLNGEEALVLSRNRYDMANGDLDRGINQQVVIEGIINSAKNINSVNEITDILNIVSNNIDTNLSTEQILSSYNILKKILLNSHGPNLINLQKLYLNGQGQMIYDEGMGMVLWNYILYKDSVDIVSKTMKENLGIIEPELIKDFNYSIKEPYTQTIIGKNNYSQSGTYRLLPDFTTYSKENALNWIISNGFSYNIEEIEDLEGIYQDGQIIKQSIPASKRLDKINNYHITLTIAKAVEITNDTNNPTIEDNSNDIIDNNILDLIN